MKTPFLRAEVLFIALKSGSFYHTAKTIILQGCDIERFAVTRYHHDEHESFENLVKGRKESSEASAFQHQLVQLPSSVSTLPLFVPALTIDAFYEALDEVDT